MEKIYIVNRTTKKSGTIKLRFRLRDGKAVDLQHKSDVTADLKELEQFDTHGQVKSGRKIYNEGLRDNIEREINAMLQAYKLMKENSMSLNNHNLNKMVDSILHPQTNKCTMSVDNRFEYYIERKSMKNGIGYAQQKHYEVLLRELRRFLTIKHMKNLKPEEFDSDTLEDFDSFLVNEYTYVEKYPSLYKGAKTTIPQRPRMRSTISTKMKILRAFFTSLENKGEISRSPFKSMDSEDKKQLLSAQYDIPVFLEAEEFQRVLKANVPQYQECKDLFLVNIAFGCRIGDLITMNWNNVAVKDGIPYVHYLPAKTARRQADNREIETPIMRFAFDILKRYDFKFPLLRYVSGKNGYNVQLKEMLKLCRINRGCPVLNHQTYRNEYFPLYELASSKLARKTHVDMTAKVQINLYASGLHKEGSSAVNRYTNMGIADKFKLLNTAFSQPFYKVNYDLKIISNDDEEKHKNLEKLLEHLDDSDKETLLKLLRKR